MTAAHAPADAHGSAGHGSPVHAKPSAATLDYRRRMHEDDSAPPADPFAGERVISEFWSIGGSNSLNAVAGRVPFGLGILLFFPLYVLNAMVLPTILRYTLTNRRLRVEHGIMRKVGQSVPLGEIDELRVTGDEKFTRTGDIEVVSAGQTVLTMAAVQTPWPARQTMWDAVQSYKQIAAAQRQIAAAQS